MEYNISKYIVSQPINEKEMLLYSTLSTSILTLENDVFFEVFDKQHFDKYPDICDELCEMGFLFVGDKSAQADELTQTRKEIVNADHGITFSLIAPTMECNARCYYCFEHGAEQGTMSLETANATADFLIKNCKEKELSISWFGGEPLMAPDIISLITKRVLAAGIKLDSTVTTNGILIDSKMIDLFHEWNVERITISLDGLFDTYNRIKRYVLPIENPFQQILKNIKLCLETGINTHLRINYKSSDYKTVHEAMKFFYEKFGKYENLYLYGAPLDMPDIKGYSEFDEDEGDIYLKVLSDSLKWGFEDDEINYRELAVSQDYDKALGELMLAPFPASCLMVNKNRFVIDHQGLLYKCQKHLGKSKFNCGDVFTGPVENEIFNYYSTENIADEECVNCRMFPICQSGCKANRLLYGSKYACPPTKSILNKLVMEYYKYLLDEQEV